jgi:hypothetical protein
MTRLVLALGLVCALGATALADIGKEELKKLARAGISDDVILTYVKTKGPVARLSADDIIDLKAAGLSDGLLTNLVSMAEPPANKPVPAPTPSSTAAATAKLLSDPSVVYDGRYYYPRSYFTSEYGAYCSPALGIGVAYYYPAWVSARCAPVAWSVGRCSTRGYSYGRAGFGACGSGGIRICNR